MKNDSGERGGADNAVDWILRPTFFLTQLSKDENTWFSSQGLDMHSHNLAYILITNILDQFLHKPGAKEALDEKRQMNMAYDVAKRMNYLYRRNPYIVHTLNISQSFS